jgi:very-short-patch-repair endonuclease
MSEPDFSTLAAKAAQQQGLMKEQQAIDAGVSREAIAQLIESETWQVVRPGVFRKKANSQTESQKLHALCLWLGEETTVVSHRSAARLHGLNLDEGDLEVTVPPKFSANVPGVIAHRSRAMDAKDRKTLRGITLTTGARTIIDLASVLEEEELAFAVEEAWRRRIAPPSWVAKRLTELGTKGRKVGALREILRDCGTRTKPLESALEVKVWRLLKASGLPLPKPNYEFRDDFGQPGHVDFAYPKHDLAIECDGFEFHNNPKAFEDDRLRAQRLAAVGWRVMPLTWKQVKQTPDKVLERIRHALKFRSRMTRGRG